MLALTHSGLNCNTVLLLQTLGQNNVVCFILFYQAIFCPAERELITISIMKQSVTITFSIFIFWGGGGGPRNLSIHFTCITKIVFFFFGKEKRICLLLILKRQFCLCFYGVGLNYEIFFYTVELPFFVRGQCSWLKRA